MTGDPHKGITAAEILPYTKASLRAGQDTGYKGHLGNIKLTKEDMEIVSVEEKEKIKAAEGEYKYIKIGFNIFSTFQAHI